MYLCIDIDIDIDIDMYRHLYVSRSALLAHAFQPSSGGELVPGAVSSFSVLVKHIQRTKCVIASDNDLVQAHVQAFTETVRKGRPYRVVTNEYLPWKDTVQVSIMDSGAAYPHAFLKLCDVLTDQQQRKLDGKEWTGTIAACHSVKFAEFLYQHAIDELGIDPDDIVIYTA